MVNHITRDRWGFRFYLIFPGVNLKCQVVTTWRVLTTCGELKYKVFIHAHKFCWILATVSRYYIFLPASEIEKPVILFIWSDHHCGDLTRVLLPPTLLSTSNLFIPALRLVLCPKYLKMFPYLVNDSKENFGCLVN